MPNASNGKTRPAAPSRSSTPSGVPELPRTALDALEPGRRRRLAWSWRWAWLLELAGGMARRAIDLALALALTFATLPLLPWARLRARPGEPWLRGEAYLGRWRRPIELSSLRLPGALARIPWLWGIVRGDLSFVGPEPVPASAEAELAPEEGLRFQVRPGLVSLFRLRRSANIAFESRAALDAELIHTSTVRGDLGILARSLPSLLLGTRAVEPPPELSMLDVRISNWTMEQALRWILAACQEARTAPARQMCFVNPDCLNRAWTDRDYFEVLARADLVLPDGIGIHYACRILGTALAANVNGTDLFPRLCQALEATEHRVYLLGGKPGVTDALAARMARSWPGVSIAGHHHGYFEWGGEQEARILQGIRDSGADLLLVAFGAPLQEKWIARHARELGVRVAMGVGGLFDFYSGRISRAPSWMRELGLEWVWRFLQEPRRMWRRYIVGNPLFLWRVLRWRRGGARNQHGRIMDV